MEHSGKVADGKKRGRVRYWGGRKSDKYVRAYEKPELACYRVELELHSRLLRRARVATVKDPCELPSIICPAHFQFVDVDWERLHRHLRNRLGRLDELVLAGAKERAVSLSRLRRYLRRHGIVNIHRFFVPLPINSEVARALKKWASQFLKAAYK
jgi:hypothetical protein